MVYEYVDRFCECRGKVVTIIERIGRLVRPKVCIGKPNIAEDIEE